VRAVFSVRWTGAYAVRFLWAMVSKGQGDNLQHVPLLSEELSFAVAARSLLCSEKFYAGTGADAATRGLE